MSPAPAPAPALALLGFLRLYAAPALDGAAVAPTEAALANPHTALSVLAVDGAPLGEVGPRGCATVRGLPPGPHEAAWRTRDGFVRTVLFESKGRFEVPPPEATAPPPARSSPPCAR